MRYLTLEEVLELYHRIVEQSGGSAGISNMGGLESAIAQPQMTFAGEELYPTIPEFLTNRVGRCGRCCVAQSARTELS
ncbi:MAG: hypothetical protein V7L23_32350 [Nostoc sp.]